MSVRETQVGPKVSCPRIYYLHPTLGGERRTWLASAEHAKRLGFSHILLAWPFSRSDDLFLTHDVTSIAGSDAGPILQEFAKGCRDLGLSCWIDLVIDRAEAGGPFEALDAGLWNRPTSEGLDPRTIHERDVLTVDVANPATAAGLVALWQPILATWQGLGISGVRCHRAQEIPLAIWRDILAPVRQSDPDFRAMAWVAEPSTEARANTDAVFDFVASTVSPMDDVRIVEDYNSAGSARPILSSQDPFAGRRSGPSSLISADTRPLLLHAASFMADGWLMPMGSEYGMTAPFYDARPEDFDSAQHAGIDFQAQIRTANDAAGSLVGGTMQLLHLDEQIMAVTRKSAGRPTQLVVLNRDTAHAADIDVEAMVARTGFEPELQTAITLPPAGGSVLALKARAPITGQLVDPPASRPGLAAGRLAIEAVTPAIDAGRFPVKRLVGDRVEVEADIFSDGHDVLRADVLWRAVDEAEWSRAPMEYLVNDRWQGVFPLLRTGRHVFAIEAWWSEFGTFRRDLIKKRDAGLDIALEILEGRLLLQAFAKDANPPDRAVIEDHLRQLGQDQADGAKVLLSEPLREAMEGADPRPHALGSDRVYPIEADREGAAFASWYELFPRSITDDPARHGTFRDVIGRLPAIKAMGFDVLYFPPIHPIGKANRKGRNNTLTPSPDDPGSPYAIGSADGGHDALHPELGNFEDFRALVRAAAAHELELALDFAIQCSPDHPWLVEHPDWFQWRPDGSMRYAENPPKKYQDIVNVDFYAPGSIPGLWTALRDVVQVWVDEGVRIFRVDNPHTKPFPFWEWLIADIRSRDPGVLFLAEAFTRPKVMYRLGKVGFSQSYTYFTWRNTKAELTEYLTQLNSEPVRDLFRPHFFVNTPDINPVFLQNSGRPGFLIRAALAATLSGLWGVYSGFELCEAAAMPGKEEYLDSEKYEIRPRDWEAPGNIIAEITRLNLIRRSHRALQSHLGVTFYNAFDDNILYFGKRSEDAREIVLVAVNLDPFNAHSAGIEVPLWEFGLPDTGSVAVEDLMRGYRFDWYGKMQTITLDPQDTPFSIWRIRAPESASL